ncbi:MAG: RNA polymerase sigma factor [Solirubrobacteraceae bacterium]
MAETFASALVAVMAVERALPDTPAAWLFGIARNELVDAVRRGQVDEKDRRQLALAPIVLDDRDIERINDLAASREVVEALSARLPAHEWEALRDHVLNDESYSNLATRIGCSEAVVRKRVSRAKAHLRTVRASPSSCARGAMSYSSRRSPGTADWRRRAATACRRRLTVNRQWTDWRSRTDGPQHPDRRRTPDLGALPRRSRSRRDRHLLHPR